MSDDEKLTAPAFEAMQAGISGYLLKDVTDPGSVISSLTGSELEAMLESGSLSEGMIPKAASCVRAVRRGVGGAHILDGRVPHALLLEIFTTEGIGTMVEQ